MSRLEQIAEGIRADFDAQTAARDAALGQTRQLTRHCAQAIRAIHRDEADNAAAELAAARELAAALVA
ncbi:MAG TPA: haloacid dehalogenase, partial [Anaerolineales bacterium]